MSTLKYQIGHPESPLTQAPKLLHHGRLGAVPTGALSCRPSRHGTPTPRCTWRTWKRRAAASV